MPSTKTYKQAILITGASSGLGAALALEFAQSDVVLGLVARRAERLEELAMSVRDRGGAAWCFTADVTDGQAMQEVVNQFKHKAGRIDLVIANAGVGAWADPKTGNAEALTAVIQTNVIGVINSLVPAFPHMVKQRTGHVVAIASIAGLLVLPRGTYGASKAAVKHLMDSFRLDLATYGISVTTVFPGFITTEMTSRIDREYPFLISAPKAAKIIKQAIGRKKRDYIFPWQWRVILPIVQWIPQQVWQRLVKRFQ